MAAIPPSSPADLDVAVGTRARGRGADYVSLTKPRLNFLVVITTLAAYYLGVADDAPAMEVVHTAVGTFLVAGGASALNQVWERHTDKLMRRTQARPLPDMRLHHREALWFGIALSVVGCLQLWLGANLLSAVTALVTLVSYVVWYTPMKVKSSLSTVVGAIPGALPAVIGWAAATNTLSYEGWVLFAIVFLWQMPHFLAIAWMFRDDYARAGMPMLPVLEPDGRSTGRQSVIYAAALLPVSLLPGLTGMATMSYLVGASALGAVVLWLAAEFAHQRTMPTARRLFFATIIYLPLLWALLLADHFRNA